MTCNICGEQYQQHHYKGDVAGDQLQDHCLQCVRDLLESARKANMNSMWAKISNKPILPDGTRQERQAVIQRHKDNIALHAKLAKSAKKIIDAIDTRIEKQTIS
tara:strand:- start:17 stop:328 length:312 start_codon:yes stop_codon:yes gene_type:complete